MDGKREQEPMIPDAPVIQTRLVGPIGVPGPPANRSRPAPMRAANATGIQIPFMVVLREASHPQCCAGLPKGSLNRVTAPSGWD